MVTRTQKQRAKQEQFEQAEQQWDLERLYRDLANVKGQMLTEGEMLHLRGLLCGHGPTQMADKFNHEPHGVASNLSAKIYSYLKGLLGIKRIENWSRVSKYLEEAGYKKSPKFPLKKSLGTSLSIDDLEGLVTVINPRCYNSQKVKFVEINLRMVIPVPDDENVESS